MPLFKLPFEANFPISTPLAGQVQPPTARSAAGTVATTGALLEAAGVAGLLVLAGGVLVLPTGRRMTVVLLDDDGLDTTVVLPVEPLLKRIACPGRMV
ncbi:hypothetical protein D3C76_1460770 [compost metagenome]